MKLFESFILGALQGIAEFLPISSSGHLLIAQEIMNVNYQGNVLEVATHLGTLLSIIVVFRNEIISLITGLKNKKNQYYVICLIIGTIPAAAFGLFAKIFMLDLIENIFVVSVSLLITGLLLLMTKKIKIRFFPISLKIAILIGISQAIAIFPGISRSGITIATALYLGLCKEEATKFSFFLAIPVILGAGILTFLDQKSLILIYNQPSFFALASISSFVTGLIFLSFLLNVIRKGNFHLFSYYCFFASAISLYITIIK